MRARVSRPRPRSHRLDRVPSVPGRPCRRAGDALPRAITLRWAALAAALYARTFAVTVGQTTRWAHRSSGRASSHLVISTSGPPLSATLCPGALSRSPRLLSVLRLCLATQPGLEALSEWWRHSGWPASRHPSVDHQNPPKFQRHLLFMREFWSDTFRELAPNPHPPSCRTQGNHFCRSSVRVGCVRTSDDRSPSPF